MFWLKRAELRSMPSMTLFEGGLAPANDSAVVNKSITVPSWWLTWQQKKIIQLRKHTCKKNTLCRLVHNLSPYLTQGNSKGEGVLTAKIYNTKYDSGWNGNLKEGEMVQMKKTFHAGCMDIFFNQTFCFSACIHNPIILTEFITET